MMKNKIKSHQSKKLVAFVVIIDEYTLSIKIAPLLLN